MENNKELSEFLTGLVGVITVILVLGWALGIFG